MMKSNIDLRKSVAELAISVIAGLLFLLSMNSIVIAQYEVGEPGPYLGQYDVIAQHSKNQMNFKGFVLRPPPGTDEDDLPISSNGEVQLGGFASAGSEGELPFRMSLLKKGKSGAFEELVFATQELKGTRYEFAGRFLEYPKQEEKGGRYTVLRGILVKFRDSKKIATAEVGFAVYAVY